MTNQTISHLFQQMEDEIAALDAVVLSVTGLFSVNGLTANHNVGIGGETQELPSSEESLVTLRQMVESRKQTLRQSSQELQKQVHQLETLYTIANQYGETTSVDRVLASVMNAVWQKTPLQFAVVVLGESELGPYHYHAMRGVSNAWQYVNNPCPFPLWGVLARALLPRLNPDEPDYFVVRNIAAENLPLCEEFPWLPRTGSLMILPLRSDKRARGAILLGGQKIDAFSDEMLCADYLAIAFQTARVLELTQMNHELNERAEQLLSLQLFTKSIATAHDYNKLVDVLVEGIFEAMGRVGVTIMVDGQSWHRELNGSTTLAEHGQRIIDWAMQAGQPIFYDPEDSEGSLERFYYNESGHALVVPILRNERTQGAIQITTDGTQRLEEGDMIVLRTIANCAAIMLREIGAQ